MATVAGVEPTLGQAAPLAARSLKRAAYLAAGAGAVHAALFLLSYFLLNSQPGIRASDLDLVRFYESEGPRRLILVGLYLMPFAGIAFVWFIVALRAWIAASGRPEDILLSNVQLVSGVVFIALFFAAAAATAAMAASVEYSTGPVDPTVARQLPSLGNALLFVFAMRMAAMFIFATSNIGRRTGQLPTWFAIVGGVVGLFLLLSATFSQLLVLVFPLWILGLAVLMVLHARKTPTTVMS